MESQPSTSSYEVEYNYIINIDENFHFMEAGIINIAVILDLQNQ